MSDSSSSSADIFSPPLRVPRRNIAALASDTSDDDPPPTRPTSSYFNDSSSSSSEADVMSEKNPPAVDSDSGSSSDVSPIAPVSSSAVHSDSISSSDVSPVAPVSSSAVHSDSSSSSDASPVAPISSSAVHGDSSSSSDDDDDVSPIAPISSTSSSSSSSSSVYNSSSSSSSDDDDDDSDSDTLPPLVTVKYTPRGELVVHDGKNKPMNKSQLWHRLVSRGMSTKNSEKQKNPSTLIQKNIPRELLYHIAVMDQKTDFDEERGKQSWKKRYNFPLDNSLTFSPSGRLESIDSKGKHSSPPSPQVLCEFGIRYLGWPSCILPNQISVESTFIRPELSPTQHENMLLKHGATMTFIKNHGNWEDATEDTEFVTRRNKSSFRPFDMNKNAFARNVVLNWLSNDRPSLSMMNGKGAFVKVAQNRRSDIHVIKCSTGEHDADLLKCSARHARLVSIEDSHFESQKLGDEQRVIFKSWSEFKNANEHNERIDNIFYRDTSMLIERDNLLIYATRGSLGKNLVAASVYQDLFMFSLDIMLTRLFNRVENSQSASMLAKTLVKTLAGLEKYLQPHDDDELSETSSSSGMEEEKKDPGVRRITTSEILDSRNLFARGIDTRLNKISLDARLIAIKSYIRSSDDGPPKYGICASDNDHYRVTVDDNRLTLTHTTLTDQSVTLTIVETTACNTKDNNQLLAWRKLVNPGNRTRNIRMPMMVFKCDKTSYVNGLQNRVDNRDMDQSDFNKIVRLINDSDSDSDSDSDRDSDEDGNQNICVRVDESLLEPIMTIRDYIDMTNPDMVEAWDIVVQLLFTFVCLKKYCTKNQSIGELSIGFVKSGIPISAQYVLDNKHVLVVGPSAYVPVIYDIENDWSQQDDIDGDLSLFIRQIMSNFRQMYTDHNENTSDELMVWLEELQATFDPRNGEIEEVDFVEILWSCRETVHAKKLNKTVPSLHYFL